MIKKIKNKIFNNPNLPVTNLDKHSLVGIWAGWFLGMIHRVLWVIDPSSI